MIVTKIESQRGNTRRINLYIDGELAFGLHRAILLGQRVREGAEVSAALLVRLQRLEELALAEQRATRLLNHRLRSEHELRTRLLQEEFTPAAVSETLDRLKSLGYVDDDRFARAFIHDRLLKRSVGRVRLANELRRKGLPGPLVASVLDEEVSATDELRRAETEGTKALRRYRGRRQDDARLQRDRLMRFLVNRGFGWDVAAAAVRRLTGTEVE
jgi:regulatory protein